MCVPFSIEVFARARAVVVLINLLLRRSAPARPRLSGRSFPTSAESRTQPDVRQITHVLLQARAVCMSLLMECNKYRAKSLSPPHITPQTIHSFLRSVRIQLGNVLPLLFVWYACVCVCVCLWFNVVLLPILSRTFPLSQRRVMGRRAVFVRSAAKPDPCSGIILLEREAVGVPLEGVE